MNSLDNISLNDVNNVGDFFIFFMQKETAVMILNKYPTLIDNVHSLLVVALTLSLVIYGIRFMMAEVATTGKQLLFTVVWVLVGLTLVEKSNYNHFILTPINTVPANLSAFFLGDEYIDKTIFEAVNETFVKVFDYANAIAETGGMTTYTPYFAAAAVYIIFGVYYALFTIIILFAQLCLSIFLLFGGIVIPISGFQLCRGVAKSWFTAVLKYALVIVITSIIVGLISGMTKSVVDSATTIDKETVMNSSYFGALLLSGFFGAFLMLKAMEISAEITGGVSTDMGSSLRTLGGAAKEAKSAMKSSKEWGGSKIKALKEARSAAKSVT